MVVRHFIVHFVYERVATKWLRMYRTSKQFHSAGFLCARHACTYANAPNTQHCRIFWLNAQVKTKAILQWLDII